MSNGNHIPAQNSGSRAEVPQVSVVIPAYNAAPYITAALDSVFAQTLSSFEVLVVNDGSLDTPALEIALKPYQGRIRYLQQENQGPSAARNTGIRSACGKYIAFLDSDDLWLPQHLSRQVAILEADPSCQLVYANGAYLRGDVPSGLVFDSNPQSLPVDFDALLHERSTVITSSTVVLRQALLKGGLFDERFRRCEDYDLWLRLTHAGVRITFTREIQICYRRANGLAGDRELMKRALIQVYEKHLEMGTLNANQSQFVRSKITRIATAIEFEHTKKALLAGDFPGALEGLQKASASEPSWKLALAEIGIRRFPHVAQSVYRLHVRRMERRFLARSARSLRDAGFQSPVVGTKVADAAESLKPMRDDNPHREHESIHSR